MLFFNVVGWMGCYSVLFVSFQDEFHRSATETGEKIVDLLGRFCFVIIYFEIYAENNKLDSVKS
jgi:hypothetical protein